jgi:hypothetical protein
MRKSRPAAVARHNRLREPAGRVTVLYGTPGHQSMPGLPCAALAAGLRVPAQPPASARHRRTSFSSPVVPLPQHADDPPPGEVALHACATVRATAWDTACVCY